MLQTKLLYLVDNSLFPKVHRRLNDTKNTNIFGIPDENIYHMTREELKMVPLVDDLDKKQAIYAKYKKHILIYHHPYYLIVPIFEAFVYKTGKVNQYLHSLTINMHRHRIPKTGDAPFFNVQFKSSKSKIQTFNAVVIKLKTNGETEPSTKN
jgi:hypothetical protein